MRGPEEPPKPPDDERRPPVPSGSPRGRRRGRLRTALAVSAVLLATLVAFALWLRRDTTEDFLEVAGRYSEARVLERWGDAESRYEHLELVNHRGEVVTTAYLRVPRRLAPDYRAFLTYAGMGTDEKILDLVPVRDDVVLMAVQYPFTPPEHWTGYPGAPAAIRHAVFRTVGGGLLGVSHLERAEGLDSSRLTLLGASLGSIFGVIHGALDERVPRVLVVHGGGDIPLVIYTMNARRGHPLRGAFLAGASSVLAATFDPVRWVDRIAPRETVFLATRNDQYFPVASIEALWEAAEEPKEIVWTETEHVRSHKPDVVAQILAEIEAYLDRTLGEADEADPRASSSSGP